MRIVTYKSGTAPERDRWCAVFYQPVIVGANKSKGIEGTPGETRHNVVFTAPDEATVIDRAEQWLAGERQRVETAARLSADKSERMKARRAVESAT